MRITVGLLKVVSSISLASHWTAPNLVQDTRTEQWHHSQQHCHQDRMGSGVTGGAALTSDSRAAHWKREKRPWAGSSRFPEQLSKYWRQDVGSSRFHKSLASRQTWPSPHRSWGRSPQDILELQLLKNFGPRPWRQELSVFRTRLGRDEEKVERNVLYVSDHWRRGWGGGDIFRGATRGRSWYGNNIFR